MPAPGRGISAHLMYGCCFDVPARTDLCMSRKAYYNEIRSLSRLATEPFRQGPTVFVILVGLCLVSDVTSLHVVTLEPPIQRAPIVVQLPPAQAALVNQGSANSPTPPGFVPAPVENGTDPERLHVGTAMAMARNTGALRSDTVERIPIYQ